jgi:hypothetical protein
MDSGSETRNQIAKALNVAHIEGKKLTGSILGFVINKGGQSGFDTKSPVFALWRHENQGNIWVLLESMGSFSWFLYKKSDVFVGTQFEEDGKALYNRLLKIRGVFEIEVGQLYKLFYNENNSNNSYFEVRGVVDEWVVCKPISGRPFLEPNFGLENWNKKGYLTPISKDQQIVVAVWGSNNENMAVVSYNDLQKINDSNLTIFFEENMKDCSKLPIRQNGNWYEYFCPLSNQWKKKHKAQYIPKIG